MQQSFLPILSAIQDLTAIHHYELKGVKSLRWPDVHRLVRALELLRHKDEVVRQG